MVSYREFGSIEDHRKVYSSGAPSQLPRGIDCITTKQQREQREINNTGQATKGAKISL